MSQHTCVLCNKPFSPLLEGKLVWYEQNGFVMLVMSRSPEAIEKLHPKRLACAPCAIRTLSFLLQQELSELQEVFSVFGDGGGQ